MKSLRCAVCGNGLSFVSWERAEPCSCASAEELTQLRERQSRAGAGTRRSNICLYAYRARAEKCFQNTHCCWTRLRGLNVTVHAVAQDNIGILEGLSVQWLFIESVNKNGR